MTGTSEANPLGACRGCMFALAFEVLAGALCLACFALWRALACC